MIDRQAITGLPMIWTALQNAGLLAGLDERARLNKSVMVVGKDGYRAALSLEEIDPEFEGKQVLIAYRRDGVALSDNELRLIVPGD